MQIWPEDVPAPLSMALLKPELLELLDSTNVLNEIDAIALSAWPNSTQLNFYLFDCRGANADATEFMLATANKVIAAVKQDEDIRSRWDFLTACGLVLRLGVYEDPGISNLRLQIVRNPDAETKLRASVAIS